MIKPIRFCQMDRRSNQPRKLIDLHPYRGRPENYVFDAKLFIMVRMEEQSKHCDRFTI